MPVIRAFVFVVLTMTNCLAAIWFEVGDAGRDLLTANVTTGDATPLQTIFGNLSAPDPFDSSFDVDIYQILVTDPFNFSAATVSAPGFYVSDPQLFLFSSAGLGVYMNDDDESGLNGSQSMLPAGHPFGPTSPGLYYLAIGWWDNEPLSLAGEIFSNTSGFGTNGPGVGGTDPLAGWSDNVLQRLDLETAYQIELTGAVVAVVPEPGSMGLMGVISLAFVVRRTRGK